MPVYIPHKIEYPSSDGQPMAENTLQAEWITTVRCGIENWFRDIPDVFVAGDLLWYPVEGEPTIRMAPDTMVVFGRPKGYRLSYLQWDEENIPPQVVFEILSPSNKPPEMMNKLLFYETYGVEEYYIYDPDNITLQGYRKQGTTLIRIRDVERGWTSPLLKIRLELRDKLILTDPNGQPLLYYTDLAIDRDEKERLYKLEKQRAEAERQRAEAEKQKVEIERQRAEAERQRAEAAQREAEEARQRAEQLIQQQAAIQAEMERLREQLRLLRNPSDEGA